MKDKLVKYSWRDSPALPVAARLLWALFFLVIFLALPARAEDPAATQVEDKVRPIFNAFARAAIQGKSLGLETEANKLIALGLMDTAGRDLMENTDLSDLPAPYRQIAADVVWDEIGLHDRENQKQLKTLMPAKGWFDEKIVGKEASMAAFLIVQHAINNRPFMVDVLQRMKSVPKTQHIDGRQYALLVDRVAQQGGLAQTYGTQFICKDNHWQVYTVRDPARVDELRKSIGYDKLWEDDIKIITSKPPCFIPSSLLKNKK